MSAIDVPGPRRAARASAWALAGPLAWQASGTGTVELSLAPIAGLADRPSR